MSHVTVYFARGILTFVFRALCLTCKNFMLTGWMCVESCHEAKRKLFILPLVSSFLG